MSITSGPTVWGLNRVGLIGLLVMAMLAAMAAPLSGAEEPTPPEEASARIAPDLIEKLDDGGEAPIVIKFEERPDLSAASGIADWEERGWFVYEQLTATAERSQTEVRDRLDALGVDHHDFWISNVIVTSGDSELVNEVAGFSNVEQIGLAEDIPLPQPEPGRAETDNQVNSVEWGVEAIGADQVWDEFGVTGEGVVVGILDSGAMFNHPALVDSYRGNNGDGTFDHAYNWFDPADPTCPDVEVPCDRNGHGTHVAGTVLGDDGQSHQIGVAPDAQWIAAQGCENSFCSQAALLGAGQFLATPTDPDGKNPEPGLRPHIINNSWGGGPDDLWYEDVVDSWIAFGIFPMFASGNPGDACGAGGSPGDYPQSYSTGAFNSSGEIYNRSGRGPSQVDGSVNPNISAPGVNVRSSWNNGSYRTITGTSMASPHVSGTVALMWSAAPTLVGDIAATRSILDQTSIDTEDLSCGGTAEKNNVWGEGKLDAYEAVEISPRGDAGVISGTVTSTDGGTPIEGAKVAISGPTTRTVYTAENGSYSVPASVGDYQLEVEAYGFLTETATATVTVDETTTVDIALEPAPVTTVSGTVTDGSGHGFPLYARIDIEGYPNGPVFTDPTTGTYEVDLLEGTEYVFEMSVVSGGYATETRPVTLPSSETTQDFTATLEPGVCTAPGYVGDNAPLFETFDEPTIPDGWEVIDHVGNGQQWAFDNPGERDNMSGGEGGFAILDRNFYGSGTTQVSDLITPVMDLSGATSPTLSFNHDFRNVISRGAARIDLTTDGGEIWQTIWEENLSLRGPRVLELPIPQAAGSSQVQIRFNYNVSLGYWWQVDNVTVSDCSPVEGGLVAGQVLDSHTGDPIDGATVSMAANPEWSAMTRATPDDDSLGNGFYLLFSPTSGPTDVEATADLYATTTDTIDIVAADVVSHDFQLGSGFLEANPGSVQDEVVIGDASTVDVTVENSGNRAVNYRVREREGGYSPTRGSVLDDEGAPVIHVDGEFSPKPAWEAEEATTVRPSQSVTAPPWEDVADLPDTLMDNTATLHPSGDIYMVGGINNINDPGRDDVYRYDAENDSWEHFSDVPDGARAKPVVEIIDNRLHVVAGSRAGVNTNAHAIYDFDLGAWETGAPIPSGYFGSASAVVDDELYVVGGCKDPCWTDEVYRYDPADDEWTELAAYPVPVSWTHCGVISGNLVCAGGISDEEALTDVYSYAPELDQWTELESMPTSMWAGGYATPTDPATGRQVLVVSGGVINGMATVTNEGYAFDPETGEWGTIPNSNYARYRGASACGFYKLGGSISQFLPSSDAERLPGLVDCGVVDVEWLGLDEPEGTIPAGGSVTVTVTMDSGVDELTQPGTYDAELVFRSDTPNQLEPVGVTMDVRPDGQLAHITGTVNSLGKCDEAEGAASGALIEIGDEDTATNQDGTFGWWVQPGSHTVVASRPGYVPTEVDVDLGEGSEQEVEMDLRADAPCEELSEEGLRFDASIGADSSESLSIANTGASPMDFDIAETPLGLDPIPEQTDRTAKSDADWKGPGEIGELSVRSLDIGEAVADETEAAPWFGGADIPGGRFRYGVAQCDGDDGFYVVSGIDSAVNLTPSMLRYEPATNSWIELAPVPAPTEGPTAVCGWGKIHVFGGSATTFHFIYDIDTDTWEMGAPVPRIVWGASAGFWEGKIYLVGGAHEFTFGDVTGAVNVYDVTTDTWEDAPPMPHAALVPGSVQIGSYLYLVGGWSEDTPAENLEVTQRLDLIDGTWELGPELPVGRADMALSATNQALYAAAGDIPGGSAWDFSSTVTRLDLDDWEGGAWEEIEELPLETMAGSAGACTTGILGGEIWEAGGVRGGPMGSVVPQVRSFFREVPDEECASVRSNVPWLSVSPGDGSVDPDSTRDVTVAVDTGDLEVGTYHATLLVNTNDIDTPERRIPITVVVTEADDPEPPTTVPDDPDDPDDPDGPGDDGDAGDDGNDGGPGDDGNDRDDGDQGDDDTGREYVDPDPGFQFGDVAEGHLFDYEIHWLAANKITLGCNPPDNTMFCPDDSVTRGQMAAFLVRALDLPDGDASFEDTVGHLFERDIAAIAEAGITIGCNPPDNTMFCPDAEVTRGQMAAFLVRALDLPAGDESFDDTTGHVFEDDVSALAEARVTIGCNPPDNTLFCPNDEVTRGQMAAFLYRALDG